MPLAASAPSNHTLKCEVNMSALTCSGPCCMRYQAVTPGSAASIFTNGKLGMVCSFSRPAAKVVHSVLKPVVSPELSATTIVIVSPLWMASSWNSTGAPSPTFIAAISFISPGPCR